MKTILNYTLSTLMIISALFAESQTTNQDENKIKFTGEFLSDQRFLTENKNNWAWNENRITLKSEKKKTGISNFSSEIWVRNIGVPKISNSADLFNKSDIDPFQVEIREAFVELYNFPFKNADLKIGRQRLAWGTADKINPTDNLNQYDMEDLLDFGRKRPTDAISFNYYLNNDFSVQAVFVPIFRPANLPIGIFSEILNPEFDVPEPLIIKETQDRIINPEFNLKESSTYGIRFKGFMKGIDFSFSYSKVYDGLPHNTFNLISPIDILGGVKVNSDLSFSKADVLGFDLSTNFMGIGIWAEAALFFSENDIIMRNDLTPLLPVGSDPLIFDSLLINSKEPYYKTVVGFDYHFKNKTYLNIQYFHGFVHERGRENMNNYILMTYDINFFREKLKLSPIAGAFSFKNFDFSENYAIAYMPKIQYKASTDTEISIAALFTNGKGDNMFTKLRDYNMLIFSLKHFF